MAGQRLVLVSRPPDSPKCTFHLSKNIEGSTPDGTPTSNKKWYRNLRNEEKWYRCCSFPILVSTFWATSGAPPRSSLGDKMRSYEPVAWCMHSFEGGNESCFAKCKHVYVDSKTRHNLQNEPKWIKIGHPGNPSPRSTEGFGRILNGQPFEDAGSNNRATFPATINCASFINNTTMPASWQLNMCMLHLVKTNAVLVYMCFCESSCRRYSSSVLLQATKNSAACQPLNTSEIYAVNWHQFRGMCAALIYRVVSMKLQMYSVHVISPTNKSNWALQNSHITRYHVWFVRPGRAEIHGRSHPLVGIRCHLICLLQSWTNWPL